MIKKSKHGWVVMNADGTKPLSADLSRRAAEKKQQEIAERSPSLIWARERGKLVKED